MQKMRGGHRPVMMPRLREKYVKEVIPNMMKEFSYKNIMEVPRVQKVVLNVGLGEAIQNIKLLVIKYQADLSRASGRSAGHVAAAAHDQVDGPEHF